MYGLLLESVRFFIKQRYGQEAWDNICKNCGLTNSYFSSRNDYADILIPKLSDACSKTLPCGLPSAAYMEYFGNAFVDFTSSLGYSKVLKVYGRSFRDFLDNIDSLHEHLRFGFPRLQPPSFECREETSCGLTLHYISRRFGYQHYVIGQVKEVAKLYFNLDINVQLLEEAEFCINTGTRLCHVTYRVIFENSSFVPLVKEHKMLNTSLSVPVDLVFKISPFSFLIDKNLKIFRAASDLNQYFGESMTGKRVNRVFTVRRPPIDLTWESLITHGRVIFELVAKQASNISLFTYTGSRGAHISTGMTKKNEIIQKIKNLGKTNPASPRNDNHHQRQRSNTVRSSEPVTGLENCKNFFAGSTRSKSADEKFEIEKSPLQCDRGRSKSRQTKVAVDVSFAKPTKGITAMRDQNFICNFEKKQYSKENNTSENFEFDHKKNEDYLDSVRFADQCPINEKSSKKPDSFKYQGNCNVGKDLMSTDDYLERCILVKTAESCIEEGSFKEQIICRPELESRYPTLDEEEGCNFYDSSPTFYRPEPIGRNFSYETNFMTSIGSDKSRGNDSHCSKRMSDTRTILRPEPIGQEAERISKSVDITAHDGVEANRPNSCSQTKHTVNSAGFVNSRHTKFDASSVNVKGKNLSSGKVANGMLDVISVENSEGDSKPPKNGKISIFGRTFRSRQILDGSNSTTAGTVGNAGDTRSADNTRTAGNTRAAGNTGAARKAKRALEAEQFEKGTGKCDIVVDSSNSKGVGCTRKKRGKSAAKEIPKGDHTETGQFSNVKERKTKPPRNVLFSSIRERMVNIGSSCLFRCGTGRISKQAQAKSQNLEELQNPVTEYQLPKTPTNMSIVDLQTPKPYSAPPIRKFPVIDDDVIASNDIHKRVEDTILKSEKRSQQRNLSDDKQTGKRRKRVENWLQRQQCRPLLLRGQIKYIEAWSMVLFIGTPLIGTVDDLRNSGLYLSDLNMHDGSQCLTMQGTQRLSEIEFACDREKLKGDLLRETTLKLEEEKNKTEQLLYSMMPREIAERMKNGDRELTTCDTFDDVTILFGIIQDFAAICIKVDAMTVVQLVSEVFSLFDILSESHKVYKFETIGGGVYMLVSGVPVKIEKHAREMALMALSMLRQVQTLVNPLSNKPLELQIGIHSGPVVAGVIGQTTLQYCLFGNTVNVASRMQSTGSPMKIHLSEATNRELQSSEFITEYRGRVPVKGVGNLNTYWLICCKEQEMTNNNCSAQFKQNCARRDSNKCTRKHWKPIC